MQKYDNLDGYRVIGAISIIFMHILVNTNYLIVENFFIKTILKAGIYVQMFFMLSAFGMCCGYYEKIKNNEMSLDYFFKKRYIKILPYFAMLVLLDVVVSGFAYDSIVEGFSDITLLFAFFPAPDISVIGVGWALGVIFAFYCLFPFFVFTIWTKKKAWVTFVVSLGIYFVCTNYFLVDGSAIRCNFMRWSCYFIAGGLIYLYRQDIQALVLKFKRTTFILCVISTTIWFIINEYQYINMLNNLLVIFTIAMFSMWISLAISINSKILSNKITKFLNSVSFEIYLAHMVIFRVFEKLNLQYLFGVNGLSYVIFSITVIICTTIFAWFAQKVIDKVICMRIRD